MRSISTISSASPHNQIIGSLNPDQYQTCYQYAVGLNATKPFGNETPQSTCCGGTGSENHTKYQQSAYFANDNTLWVGLYMPTTLHWKEKGVTIKQDCLWPAQRFSHQDYGRRGRFHPETPCTILGDSRFLHQGERQGGGKELSA